MHPKLRDLNQAVRLFLVEIQTSVPPCVVQLFSDMYSSCFQSFLLIEKLKTVASTVESSPISFTVSKGRVQNPTCNRR